MFCNICQKPTKNLFCEKCKKRLQLASEFQNKQKEKPRPTIAIKVTLEKEIWIDEDVWKSFGEELPTDAVDLEMLEDEKVLSNTELKNAEVVARFDRNNYGGETK